MTATESTWGQSSVRPEDTDRAAEREANKSAADDEMNDALKRQTFDEKCGVCGEPFDGSSGCIDCGRV